MSGKKRRRKPSPPTATATTRSVFERELSSSREQALMWLDELTKQLSELRRQLRRSALCASKHWYTVTAIDDAAKGLLRETERIDLVEDLAERMPKEVLP